MPSHKIEDGNDPHMALSNEARRVAWAFTHASMVQGLSEEVVLNAALYTAAAILVRDGADPRDAGVHFARLLIETRESMVAGGIQVPKVEPEERPAPHTPRFDASSN